MSSQRCCPSRSVSPDFNHLAGMQLLIFSQGGVGFHPFWSRR